MVLCNSDKPSRRLEIGDKIWVTHERINEPGIYIRETTHRLHRVLIWTQDKWKSLTVLKQDIKLRKKDISEIIYEYRKEENKDKRIFAFNELKEK